MDDRVQQGNREQRRAAVRRAKRAAGAALAASGTALATTAAFLGATAQPAGAAPIVTNLSDSDPGSLRDAIDNAASGDTINFAPGLTGTITLTSGSLVIGDDKNLTIQGPGADRVTVSGNNSYTVFYLVDGDSTAQDVTISGLTITKGAPACGCGGGIVSFGENLHLHDAVVTDNAADIGAGILIKAASLDVQRSKITGNHAGFGGGGIAFFGYSTNAGVSITSTEISGNTASTTGFGGGGGGFLYGLAEPVEIVDTTISGNSAPDVGGALLIGGVYDDLLVRNTTISGNTAPVGAGLAIAEVYAELTIANSTISGNTTGSGITTEDSYGLYLFQDTITGNGNSGVGPQAAATTQDIGQQVKDIVAKAHAANPGPHGASHAPSGGPPVHSAVARPDLYVTHLVGTIIAGNLGPFDVDDLGDVQSTNSLVGTVNTSNTTVTDNGGTITGQSPLLGPLVDNGGPTRTHALLSGSPALNTGPNPVPTFPGNQLDQRGNGFARVFGGRADIGAFELQGPTATVNTPCGVVTVTSSVGELQNLTSTPLPASPSVPAGLAFPCGLLSFRIIGVAPGGTATVTVTAPVPINDYYKLQGSAYAHVSGTTPLGPNQVRFTLTDGGTFDADGSANSIVVDPGAPAQTAAATAAVIRPTFTG